MGINLTTLLFESINFVVLVFVLWRVLYRPLRASIEKRRAAVEEDLEAARAAREEAKERELEWAAREQELVALREQTRREALDAAEKEKSRILERAREDASAELSRARQLLETEHEAARHWVRTAIWQRSTDLAGRMLVALAPDDAPRILGDRLVELIDTNADAIREEAEEAPGLEVSIAGTRMPDAELLDALRASLTRALGHAPRFSTHEDESLVAGWTLRVGDRLFDASVAGQLEAFRALARELEGEERVGAA